MTSKGDFAAMFHKKTYQSKLYIGYSPAGRFVLGKTVPEVLDTARGRSLQSVEEQRIL